MGALAMLEIRGLPQLQTPRGLQLIRSVRVQVVRFQTWSSFLLA